MSERHRIKAEALNGSEGEAKERRMVFGDQ